MSVAYVDTSCLVAIAFGERSGGAIARRLGRFDDLLASNLLEGELRSAFARERASFEPSLVGGLRWILPQEPLSAEMERVLRAGYVRGADLWHLACALSVVTAPEELTFLTLDETQRSVASTIGFLV